MVTDPDEMQTQDTSKAYEQVKIEEEKPDSVNCSVGADKREHAESFASCGKTALEETAISARDLDKIQEGKSKRCQHSGFRLRTVSWLQKANLKSRIMLWVIVSSTDMQLQVL